MRDGIRADIAARVLLTLGALLPYWRLLTFGVIYVTDDFFASDIFNGELPGRALVGQLIREGQVPQWTSQLCSGVPLAGAPADPIGLAVFSLLPPAAALDLFVIVVLLVAAHGTYGFARRLAPIGRAQSWPAWPSPARATSPANSSISVSSPPSCGCRSDFP